MLVRMKTSIDSKNDLENNPVELKFMNIGKYFTDSKMLRVTAHLLRFINNSKGISKKTNANLSTFITKHERDLAEHLWLIHIQKEVYTDKQYEQLKHDLGFIVIVGVIRCKGRLSNSSLSFNTKHPIFLPKCYFTKLVTLYDHQKVLHNGATETLNEVKKQFGSQKQETLFSKQLEVVQLARSTTLVLINIQSTKQTYQTREYPVNYP